MLQLDTLWLSGAIPDGRYSRGLYEWKRRLLRLAGGIRSIVSRAMVVARKQEAQEAAGSGAEGEIAASVHIEADAAGEAAAPADGSTA